MAELYLGVRGCGARAGCGGPTRLAHPLPPGTPRIAVNIHSWSEAPLGSIQAWLELLGEAGMEWLMLATHDHTAVTLEAAAPHRPMIPAILEAGWRLIEDRPRYQSLPRHSGWMWLFRRG